jgi:hypothetical protein
MTHNLLWQAFVIGLMATEHMVQSCKHQPKVQTPENSFLPQTLAEPYLQRLRRPSNQDGKIFQSQGKIVLQWLGYLLRRSTAKMTRTKNS